MEYTHRDGTPFTKEEFLEKLRTDKEFNDEFGSKGIDQIQNLINDLKTNPDSRRMMVSAWAVHDLPNMVLPPCHYGFQVWTRELSFDERYALLFKRPYDGNALGKINTLDYMDDKNIPTRAISLMCNMRSTDVGLGLPFNLASYGLLLMMIAKQVNMVPDELIYNGGDVHIYSTHIEPIKEQLDRNSYQLPTVEIHGTVEDIAHYEINDISLKNYQHHPAIKLPLSN